MNRHEASRRSSCAAQCLVPAGFLVSASLPSSIMTQVAEPASAHAGHVSGSPPAPEPLWRTAQPIVIVAACHKTTRGDHLSPVPRGRFDRAAID